MDWHPAALHMLDVAACAQALLASSPLRRQLGEWLPWMPFLVALHDVGKFSDAFQRLSPAHHALLHPEHAGLPPLRIRHRHTETGFALCVAMCRPNQPLAKLGFGTGPGWANLLCAIAGHHGEPTHDATAPGYDFNLRDAFTPSGLRAAVDFVADATALLAPGTTMPVSSVAELRHLSWLVSGLTTLADWLGSSSETFPFSSADTTLPRYWSEKAVPQAERAVAAAGFGRARAAGERTFDELFPHLAGRIPSPLQRAALDLELPDGPAIVILEDRPGSGKTEAAVTLVNRRMAGGHGSGFFIALPTTATASSMYERMSGSYRRLFTDDSSPSLILAHGRASYSDSFTRTVLDTLPDADPDDADGALCAAWLSDTRRKALLADAGVGTVDQVLLASMAVRFHALRLVGVAGKVLVVDEVHACDAYMHGLLKALVRFQGALGGSVVLMSATLTLHQRQELLAAFAKGCGATSPVAASEAFPSLTAWTPAGLTERAVAPSSSCTIGLARLGSDDEALALLEAASQAGRSGCWVRNTVADANAAYDALVARIGAANVMLFHARFPAGDRERLETELLDIFGHPNRARQPERRAGMVVVATQVIEQSLDIDFDEMVSDLAPMDLLIQRSGRLHRHNRGARTEPVLHVLGPSAAMDAEADWFSSMFGRAAHVYKDHGHLWTTMRLVEARGQMLLPNDTRALIEQTFAADAPVPPSLADISEQVSGARLAETAFAGHRTLNPDAGYEWTAGWDNDEGAKTRLGDSTVTLRLFRRRRDGALVPWSDAIGMKGYADGDISFPSYVVDEAIDEPGADKDVLQTSAVAARHWLPVVMTRTGDRWVGAALSCGKPVLVEATALRGVTIRKEGQVREFAVGRLDSMHARRAA